MPVSGLLNAMLNAISCAICQRGSGPRIVSPADDFCGKLFAQISKTVRQALRHQQYRFEDLRRDLGRIGQEQNIAWLGVDIQPFDYHLKFDGAATISNNLSNSSAEDLMVFMYDQAGTGLRFDLDANPALYEYWPS